jgi:hypothetical protein
MSEPSPPETPSQNARALLWLIISALVVRCIETFDGSAPFAFQPLVLGVLATALAVVDAARQRILARTPALTHSLNKVASDGRWWVGAAIAALLFVALTPYVEQRRWPLEGWFPLR